MAFLTEHSNTDETALQDQAPIKSSPPAKIDDAPLTPMTLQTLFDQWKETRWEELGKANRTSMNAAYQHCIALADWQYRDIKTPQMQWCIDHCNRGYATQGNIKALWGHLDRYAQDINVIPRLASDMTTIAPIPEKQSTVFSDAEISMLWKRLDLQWVDTVLFQIYTGIRSNEMISIHVAQVDLCANTIQLDENGRVIPIHSSIRPVIERWITLSTGDYLLEYRQKPVSWSNYRVIWRELMAKLHLQHVPRHCRYTFKEQLYEARVHPSLQRLLMYSEKTPIPEDAFTEKQLTDLHTAVQSMYANVRT